MTFLHPVHVGDVLTLHASVNAAWRTSMEVGVRAEAEDPLPARPGTPAAYVINERCIGVKDNSCVEVCPVDCSHPRPDEPDYDQHEQLFIDPEECIDCDACVEACPVDAITSEDQVPTEWRRFIELNAAHYRPKAA